MLTTRQQNLTMNSTMKETTEKLTTSKTTKSSAPYDNQDDDVPVQNCYRIILDYFVGLPAGGDGADGSV
jgi:hypothetical protein